MRLLLSLLLVFSTTFSFADTQIQADNYDEIQAIELVQQKVGEETTCIDEYLTRQAKVKKFLIWAPPTTVVAAPAAFFIGGYTAAGITSLVGIGGWSALGYTILGAVGSGVGVIGSFVALEVSRGLEFANNQKMIKIITAAQTNTLEHKTFAKFVNRFNKKYSENAKSAEELAQIVLNLDENGQLCDGSVRGYINPKNLKYSLAKRRHLMKFINNNF